jgi:hypothetical protein
VLNLCQIGKSDSRRFSVNRRENLPARGILSVPTDPVAALERDQAWPAPFSIGTLTRFPHSVQLPS